LAFEQFQGAYEQLAFFEDVKDLTDVRMIHAGQRSRFTPKPGAGFFAFLCFEDGFNRYGPFETIIPTPFHCSFADLEPDPEMADGFQHAAMIVRQERAPPTRPPGLGFREPKWQDRGRTVGKQEVIRFLWGCPSYVKC
jgi:hypothetical protein